MLTSVSKKWSSHWYNTTKFPKNMQLPNNWETIKMWFCWKNSPPSSFSLRSSDRCWLKPTGGTFESTSASCWSPDARRSLKRLVNIFLKPLFWLNSRDFVWLSLNQGYICLTYTRDYQYITQLALEWYTNSLTSKYTFTEISLERILYWHQYLNPQPPDLSLLASALPSLQELASLFDHFAPISSQHSGGWGALKLSLKPVPKPPAKVPWAISP